MLSNLRNHRDKHPFLIEVQVAVNVVQHSQTFLSQDYLQVYHGRHELETIDEPNVTKFSHSFVPSYCKGIIE